MDKTNLLNEKQMELLAEYHELIDALYEITTSDEYESLFGEMTIGEAVTRYENTLNDENVGWEHDIRERYEQFQARKDEPDFIVSDDDDFSKLEAKYRA